MGHALHMSLGRIAAHDAPVEGLLVAAEHGYLVSCSTDNTVRVWDYGAGGAQGGRHLEEFRCIAYHRGTEHVIAGTDQHSIVCFRSPRSSVSRVRVTLSPSPSPSPRPS